MYFGSVRFFKHLIVSVVLIIIAVLGVLCGVFAYRAGESEKTVQKLETERETMQVLLDYYNGSNSSHTVDELYVLLNHFGIDAKEFINYVYKNKPEAFDSIKASLKEDSSAIPADATVPEKTETTPAETTEKPITTTTTTAITTAATEATYSEPAETTAVTDATIPETAAETTAAETMAENHDYSELFPELVAENVNIPESYIDDEGTIYFTFDDGPTKYTNDILNYLQKYNLKATFFVIPDDTETCKNYLNRIIDEGHTIGIHTASHVYKDIYADVESYLADFKKAYDMVYEQTGIRTPFFRFPGGSVNDYNCDICDELVAEMTRRGFIYYDWNVDSRDAMDATWTEMYNTVLTEVGANKRSVILMHDRPGGLNTVLVLEDIIKALISDPKNYKFAAIGTDVRPMQF